MAESKLTATQREEACRLYVSGKNACEVAREYGVSSNSVRGLLKARGIPVRGLWESHPGRYRCDDAFFDAIDCERKAYWLGFIAADGCIITDHGKSIVSIRLKEADREHLELFKTHIGSVKPLYFGSTSAFGGRFNSYEVVVSSRQMVAALATHGIHPRKSLTHEWPDFLEGDLLRHYVRGYFDGDGSFSAKEGDPISYRASFVGNRQFLEGCRAYLLAECGPSKPQVRLLRKDGKIHALSYGGRLKVQRFARFLYGDATVWLPRKREKIAHLLPAEPTISAGEVRKRRRECGWTQKQLAEMVGVWHQTIGEIEAGRSPGAPATIEALRTTLGLL